MSKNQNSNSIFSIKAQSSLEFLMIFGIGFTIIIILGGIFFSFSGEAKSSLDQKQLQKTGDEIISNIEKIYFLGNNNMITLTSTFPDGIDNFTIEHVNNSNGGTYVVFDYLNISYIGDKGTVSNTFTTKETYTRFNCTKCYHTTNIGGNYTSYFNSSDYTGGVKKMKIQSRGDFVSIDFVNE